MPSSIEKVPALPHPSSGGGLGDASSRPQQVTGIGERKG